MDNQMKEVERLEDSGAVLKKKSSSGCLIIKKKIADGVGGFNDSSSRNLLNSIKEKKRPQVVRSDSESSDAPLEPLRRKIGEFYNGSVVSKRDFMENKDIETAKRVNNEYDGLDERAIRKDVHDERAIRLQGKNGVLKVMVNKHKQTGVVFDNEKLNVSHESHDHGQANKKKAVMWSSYNLDSNHPAKSGVSKSKEKGESKSTFATSNKGKEGTITPPTDNVAPVKGKESKVKGSVTEKQLLREKIRKMLLGAGWTIDYRPRRNRDYLDAVYINPTGTAYWSIVKAYEALQKEEKDQSKAGEDFTHLPDELLSKLTRQTRKKIERELKKKKRDEDCSKKAKRARVKEYAENTDRKHTHKKTKRKLEKANQECGGNLTDNPEKQKPKKDRTLKRKIGRCTLLVRSSEKGLISESNGFVPYSGKRTLISWLIDSGTVHLSEKVEYMNLRRTRIMQEGWITKEGIQCGCCSKILTVSRFELHAGSKLGQPFLNNFLQSGKSLMQCQIDAWNKQRESEQKGFHAVDVNGDDPNDDTCGLCGDGGDLICCDGCPSTFHQSCLSLQMLPQGDWHCPNCSCKYYGVAGWNCTEANDRTESPLLVCCLCEKKYHESCSLKMGNKSLDSYDLNLSFCGLKCQELYSHLQKLLGVKNELDSGFSWSLIHRSDLLPDIRSEELSMRVECNSKLAVALSVIDECFLPIIDRRSGINLIHNVVYNCGSNISRLNYSGFFTAILERGDEMISAASIRIHGSQLAEMPFIGTRHIYRRQGMCRRLLSAIESALSSLQIEKLIIPSIAEHMHTWTNVFGFNVLEESHKQEMRSINMLVFPGTDMLVKPLDATPETNMTSKKGERIVDLGEKIGTRDSSPTVPLEDDSFIDIRKETLSIRSPVKDDFCDGS